MQRHQTVEHKLMIRKIAVRAFFAISILFILYLWVFGIFSNINNFWRNFRGASKSLSSDLLSPIPPYINKIPAFTNKESIEISGSSENGTKVELYLNGTKVSDTISDKDGSFNFGQVKIQPSRNTFYAVAYDDAGNKSIESVDQIISFDNEKPKIEILEPEAGKTYSSKVRTLKVLGKTEGGSKVTVNGQIAVMQEDGSFSAQIYPVEGGNKITLDVTDPAGNSNKAERFFSFNEE